MSMTIDEALEFADEWSRGVTIYPGAQGWRVVCMLLADEVRRLREERNPLAERVTELEQQGPRRGVQGIGRGMTYDEWLAQQENACDAVMYGRKVWEGAWSEIEQQLAAKDDEIRDLVTSDNKVVADLSRYVETLEQKIADKNDAYRAACAVVAKMHEAAIGEVVGPVLGVVEVVANVREQLIEAQKQIDELRQQLAAFHSAVEHVTEDGCTRRSFVAMPEGWAMVHKDRLHALELAEEQLAATDGLDQYILCEKEPVVWMQSDHLSRFVHHACGAQSALVRCSDHQLMPDFQPLYRAMKVRVAREKNAKNC